MTDVPTLCPTIEQLKALIDGSLPDDQQPAVQTHVDGCAICQKSLESLVAGTESWDSAIGHLRDKASPEHETVLSDAIRRMKADEYLESSGSGSPSVTDLSFLTPSDRPGSIGRLGPYEVTEIVGEGGMGVVLKAFDPTLHRVVAVKVLAPYLAHNPQARKRFVREAQAIAAVSHDHVITIHAIDESAEQPKIVMQFIAGCSLQQKIDADGSLDLKEILRIGMQTAAGLAAAHAQGLVHRDIKPSNILLENGIQRVKLTDFGLARAVDDASLTQSGAIAGTPQYMAPEQANGDAVDYRADLFSLGSVLYAMCVGHSPFRASTTMGVLKRVCHDPPRPIQELNPDIPDWLCAIVMKLLEKKPEDRFPTSKAVAELLEKWLAHVQQPMVVPKPSSVQDAAGSASGAAFRPKVPATANADSSTEKRIQGSRVTADQYARTIFFQMISARTALFLLLTGTALFMALSTLNVSHGSDWLEFALVNFAGGLVFSFVGLLLLSLVRFVWANVRGIIDPRHVNLNAEGATSDHLDPSVKSSLPSGWLPPESLAVLAAIIVIMLSGNPLIATVVAIIVWRVATSRAALFETQTSDETQYVAETNNPPSDQASELRQPSGKKAFGNFSVFARTFIRLWTDGFNRILDPAAPDRNRLMMTIGWCLAGGIDLCALGFMISVSGRVPFPLFIFSTLAAGMSFIAAHCVYSRQNIGIVRMISFFGLLPISFGSLVRFPLSVATLFWLNSPATRSTFQTTLWPETDLAALLNGMKLFVRRSAATVGWIAVWSLGWIVFLTAIAWLVLLPFGPSYYVIKDKCSVTLKGHPNSEFPLIATGRGTIVGLDPPIRMLRRQHIIAGSDEYDAAQGLNVSLGTHAINTATNRELVQSDVEAKFSTLFHESYPEHAAGLLRAIRRLESEDGDAGDPSETPSSQGSAYTTWMKAVSRGLSFDGGQMPAPWPGFVRFGSMLDPDLFEVHFGHDSNFDCRLSDVMLTLGFLGSIMVWITVSILIIKRRHFRRNAKPVVATAS